MPAPSTNMNNCLLVGEADGMIRTGVGTGKLYHRPDVFAGGLYIEKQLRVSFSITVPISMVVTVVIVNRARNVAMTFGIPVCEHFAKNCTNSIIISSHFRMYVLDEMNLTLFKFDIYI
uniref:Uncharacterized protein n=1 Tax=Anopheles culicifacies TaxID=139723 RepID=A0A182MGZ7_9DIPT